MSMQEIVFFANDRCNQENVIGQLKSGVNALRMPSDGLVSNWAYMVIAALAWNLKAWYGLVTCFQAGGEIKHYEAIFPIRSTGSNITCVVPSETPE